MTLPPSPQSAPHLRPPDADSPEDGDLFIVGLDKVDAALGDHREPNAPNWPQHRTALSRAIATGTRTTWGAGG